MDFKIKTVISFVVLILVCSICYAQASFSFFNVTDGIHYSNDKGVNWSKAKYGDPINGSSYINNLSGKKFAILDTRTNAVYWSETKGIFSVNEMIRNIIRKDNLIYNLISELIPNNERKEVFISTRGGVTKMGNNKTSYIEEVVALALKRSGEISNKVYYTLNETAHKTVTFTIFNKLNIPMHCILVCYNKKSKEWNIMMNYKDGDKEICLVVPQNSSIELTSLHYQNKKSLKYYLVAVEPEANLSWQNLQKALNGSQRCVDIFSAKYHLYSK